MSVSRVNPAKNPPAPSHGPLGCQATPTLTHLGDTQIYAPGPSAESPSPAESAAAFRPGLPAAQVDRQLQSAVRHWQNAEHSVVLWYAELHRRRLFKELGFGSIHLYAAERLGFSQARSYQFLKLAERLTALPQLEKAVATGEVGWTKARAVAQVATPQSEGLWLEQAKTSSRRELEAKIDRTRKRTKVERKRDRDQLDLGAVAASSARKLDTDQLGQSDEANETRRTDDVNETRRTDDVNETRRTDDANETRRTDDPSWTQALQRECVEADLPELAVSVSVQFDSTQRARYEVLLAKLRQQGRRENKAELLLVALEALLVQDGAGKSRVETTKSRVETGESRVETTKVDKAQTNCEQRTTTGPAYQILIQKCSECEKATVPTLRGDRSITRNELSTALCDAKIKYEGERNTSTLPPRIRRRVLERDRHQCRMKGCRGRHFLHVHHIRAREDGGTHDLENLITLCGACHRALHELGKRQQLAMLNQSSRVGEPAGKYHCGPDLGPQTHREHGHARTHFIPGYKAQRTGLDGCRS